MSNYSSANITTEDITEHFKLSVKSLFIDENHDGTLPLSSVDKSALYVIGSHAKQYNDKTGDTIAYELEQEYRDALVNAVLETKYLSLDSMECFYNTGINRPFA